MASGRLMTGPSLKQFLLRSEVLRLYREMLRTIRRIPDPVQREELRRWIRTDFDNNKSHTNEEAVKMLITKGRISLKELQQSLSLLS